MLFLLKKIIKDIVFISTFQCNWIGGYETVNGEKVTGFDGLRSILCDNFDLVHEENVPFLIRETERKHQYTISHATVWRRNT